MALHLKKFPSIKLGTQSHRNRVSRERRASHGRASHASLFSGRNHNIFRIDKVHVRHPRMQTHVAALPMHAGLRRRQRDGPTVHPATQRVRLAWDGPPELGPSELRAGHIPGVQGV